MSDFFRSHGRRAAVTRSGFTLVEVCLAVLVVGLGLLTIFSLFPSGLRSAEDDTADTRIGLFAENVMDGLRGNAATITNWTDWAENFSSRVVAGLGVTANGSIMPPVPFPQNGELLRYRLVLDVSNPDRYTARLEVCDGGYGPFVGAQAVIYTEFFFTGTQP
jgi:type II secretory pathway pseudopilin PulG